MATNELEIQPVKDISAEVVDTPTEEVIPEHKSGVRIDPNALEQSGRFGKRDTVHMSLIQGGIRTKGTFSIAKGRLHSSRAFYEYQLLGPDGKPYKNGAWIREKDLRLESSG